MHPWVVEQLANEHRRDLLNQAERRRLRSQAPRRPGWIEWFRSLVDHGERGRVASSGASQLPTSA
jgi:hypothetical protein